MDATVNSVDRIHIGIGSVIIPVHDVATSKMIGINQNLDNALD